MMICETDRGLFDALTAKSGEEFLVGSQEEPDIFERVWVDGTSEAKVVNAR